MASRKREVDREPESSLNSGKKIKTRSVLYSKLDCVGKGKSSSQLSKPIFCPHCECGLSAKTYKKHRMLYYDQTGDIWNKVGSSCDRSEDCSMREESPELPNFDIAPSNSNGEEFEHQEDHPLTTAAGDSEDESWEENEENIDIDYDLEVPAVPDVDIDSIANSEESALLTWLLLFLVRLQAKFYLPETAVNCLLKFLYIFLTIISRNSTFVARMIKNFPTSTFLLKKYICSKETFVRYVVCRQCYSVYEYDQCLDSTKTSKKCTYRPHPTFHKYCNTQLLKTIHLKGGKKKLIPFKVYCYNSLQASLQKLMLRPDFVNLCEHWRKHNNSSTNIMSDVYDGRIWKEFQFIDGKPYLASPNVYALMVNIDWFQPYKHTTASVGAIYLTVMNLPCTVRYKRENTILLGIIPGPSEPEKNMNQFLRPFVKELQQYFIGIPMKVYGHTDEQTVRCLLIGVTCDMPAGRKACGFLSHSALLGCSRCLKVFPGGVGSKNYAGYDRSRWKPRTNSDHRSSIALIQKAKNKTEKEKLESKYGCRYSVLLQLPYFDCTRMLVIDPMHNLFLGTAKNMIKLWTKNDILSSKDFERIQSTVDSMEVPADIGRIPRKIETRFSGFTADQYKNWTLYYSIPSLHGIMDDTHLECWRHFVLACIRLCQKRISVVDVTVADALLLQFCQRFERTYGTSATLPNMHMHCHLKDVVLDYGPVYGFWLFAYERYNGILQNQPSSNRSVEIEVMRRFIDDNNAYAFQPPNLFCDEFAGFCDLSPAVTGSLLLTSTSQKEHSNWESLKLPSSYTYIVLAEYQIEILRQLLSVFLKVSPDQISVNSACRRFKMVHIDNLKFQCTVAMAHWDHSIFGQFPTALPAASDVVNLSAADATFRPFKISYFATASYSVLSEEESCTHQFTHAVVSWFRPHSSQFILGKPAQVWCADLFERKSGIYSFIPLDNLHFTSIKQCIHTKMKIDDDNVLVVVPIVS